jgi:hypothetical protein
MLTKLENNQIYQTIKNTQYSSLTTATLLSYLDAIKKLGPAQLPLLKWIAELYRLKALEDIDGDIGVIRSNYQAYVTRMMQTLMGYPTTTHIHDEIYTVDMAQATLSGGASTNLQLRAAVAAKQISCAWIAVWYDTAPGTSYTIDIHEDSGSDIEEIHIYPAECGKKKWTYLDTSTDNKALQADISGGGGTEVVGIVSCTCTFT